MERSPRALALELAGVLDAYDPALLDALPAALDTFQRLHAFEDVPFLDAVRQEESIQPIEVDDSGEGADLEMFIQRIRSKEFVRLPRLKINLRKRRASRQATVSSPSDSSPRRKARGRSRSSNRAGEPTESTSRPAGDGALSESDARPGEGTSDAAASQDEVVEAAERKIEERRRRDQILREREREAQQRLEEEARRRAEEERRQQEERERQRREREQRGLEYVEALLKGDELPQLRDFDDDEQRELRNRAVTRCFAELTSIEQTLGGDKWLELLYRKRVVSKKQRAELDRIVRRIVRGLNYISATEMSRLVGGEPRTLPPALRSKGKRFASQIEANLDALSQELDRFADDVASLSEESVQGSSGDTRSVLMRIWMQKAREELAAARAVPQRTRRLRAAVSRLLSIESSREAAPPEDRSISS